MSAFSSDENRPLTRRLRIVYRRKWIVALTFVVVLGATLAFTLRQQRLYTATAQVALSNQNLAAALTNTEQYTGITETPTYLAQTQADVARSPQLARLTLQALKIGEAPATFLASSTVRPLADANLLVFSVTDPDPAKAQRLAAAYANQYVTFSQGIATAALVRARTEVQRVIASNRRNRALYSQLVAKDQQLATIQALGTSSATVVNTGSRAVQTQPKVLRTVVVGAIVAIVLGIGLASLWELLDTRARSAEQIEELLGVPLLGSLAAPPRRMYERGQIAMMHDSGGVSAEAFRMLRTQVDLARLGSPCKTIMVTSCVAGEGKTTTVANLGAAMAAAGHRVAVVDLDLRGPQLQRFMAPDGASGGLTDVALGNIGLDEALVSVRVAAGVGSPGGRRTDDDDLAPDGRDAEPHYAQTALEEPLKFLAAGVRPPNPGEFSNSPALELILAGLRDRCDTVLLDTPPALLVGDALALSQVVDSILIVARLGIVKRQQLTQLWRRLESSPAIAMGVIVTGVRSQNQPYGYAGGSTE
jgi:Mrp family chromosome partitioning ATPase/capsular polysaccharide biosynthesis protein